ncbi:hypothetical protein PO909_019418, partial [Leuciscus waleckii]
HYCCSQSIAALLTSYSLTQRDTWLVPLISLQPADRIGSVRVATYLPGFSFTCSKMMSKKLDQESAAYFYPRNNRSALVLMVHMGFIVAVAFIRQSQPLGSGPIAERSLSKEILINLISITAPMNKAAINNSQLVRVDQLKNTQQQQQKDELGKVERVSRNVPSIITEEPNKQK